jgi:flagellar hook capping protein FlgD
LPDTADESPRPAAGAPAEAPLEAGCSREGARGGSGDASPSGGRGTPRPQRGHERAALLLTVVVVLGAGAAFLRAQALKLEPSPLKQPRVERAFSPRCGCRDGREADLTFALRRPSRLHVEVIDADDRVVRTIAEGRELGRGRHRLSWDGRDATGRSAPDGPYRWRLRIARGRTMLLPSPVRLDTQPPRVELSSIAPRVLVIGRREERASRRGRPQPAAGTVTVRLQASETARALLLVDGRLATRGGFRPPGEQSLRWDAGLGGTPLGPGRYFLALRARDRAGNLSAPSRRVAFRVVRARRR